MDRPLTFINEREPTPWILLIRLHTWLEYPIFDEQHIREIGCLLAESEIGRTIVKIDVVCELDRNLNNWFYFLRTSSTSSHLKEFNRKLFVNVILNKHLVVVPIHKINSTSDINLCNQHFILRL